MTGCVVDIPDASLFPLQNLPYGVFSLDGGRPRVATRIGDTVLALEPLARAFDLEEAENLAAPTLNPFMSAGPASWACVREVLQQALCDTDLESLITENSHRVQDVTLHLPIEVGDYVDFYSSEHHASNVGRIFRPDGDPLTPNWKHLPIGYHGRSGTVVVSGTPVRRPRGQRRGVDEDAPTFGPSLRLDIEAEVAFVVGVGSTLGCPVPMSAFPDHVFGVVLLNDWSARDIQAWEYVPLGPFLGKSFATSISPWVVPLAALDDARVVPPPRDRPLLAYLDDADEGPWGFDLHLEIEWNATVVSRPPFAMMYWTPAQQLAHMTVNGASLRTGDLYASGTVSGPDVGERGSFLELSWNGSTPITLSDGSERRFLEDGDIVRIRATAPGPEGAAIGLGEVEGEIFPA